MKKILKLLGIIIIILLVIIIILFLWLLNQPAVKSNYYETITSEKELEQKYINKGGFEVSYVEYKSQDKKIDKIKIWFPSKMKESSNNYPLVIMANGTGVKASKYEAIFDHLASWGFIVVGNEDESSWDGYSSSESLNFMLNLNNDPTSDFYNKIDLDNIGIAGHSQGGVGVINAVTNQEN